MSKVVLTCMFMTTALTQVTNPVVTTTLTIPEKPYHRENWNVSWYDSNAPYSPIRHTVYNAGTGDRLASHTNLDALKQPTTWKAGHNFWDLTRGSRLAGVDAVLGGPREGTHFQGRSAEGMEALIKEQLFPDLFCHGAHHKTSMYGAPLSSSLNHTLIALDQECIYNCVMSAGGNVEESYNHSRVALMTNESVVDCRVPIAHAVVVPLMKVAVDNGPRATIEFPRHIWRHANIKRRTDLLQVLLKIRISGCPGSDIRDPPVTGGQNMSVGNDFTDTLVLKTDTVKTADSPVVKPIKRAARRATITRGYPSIRQPWEIDPLDYEPYDFLENDAWQGLFFMAAPAVHYGSIRSSSFSGATVTGAFQEQAPTVRLETNTKDAIVDIGSVVRRMFEQERLEIAVQSNCDMADIAEEAVIRKAVTWMYPIEGNCHEHDTCTSCINAGCQWCLVATDKQEFVDKEWVQMANIRNNGRCGAPSDYCAQVGGYIQTNQCGIQWVI
eukprot:Blabericola_migrator_1__2438@NODE_1687_length_3997_cov_116_526463_g1094_i0_p2_GENE_NODE_1687_length_3997_cov_116_526463_g1094_i0NODE_1687_length_3997_cov_116_526463_g1094_i0_p2_ORF_typecomplete_len497_score63_87PSI/PF01437_25/0_028Propeptide_C1/PF08127_13/0_038_NODE_1687_length_3997_cov_116_526463_g1094_i09132403